MLAFFSSLMKAQWGSSGAASEPLVLDNGSCGFPSSTEYPDLEEERALYPPEGNHFLPPGRTQVQLERNLLDWWRVTWASGLAWRDIGSQKPSCIAGYEKHKNKVGESQTRVWELGNLERDLRFHSFILFSISLIRTAALVSLESLGPGGVLFLQAAELSGLLQHCHSPQKPPLQPLENGAA